MISKISIDEKFRIFSEHWSPRIVAEANESYVKLARFKGEFIWHRHENEDELFLVVSGEITVKFRDQEITLKNGELLVVPRGVEHKPVAESEAQVLMIEPKSTVNTGNIENERTVSPEWI